MTSQGPVRRACRVSEVRPGEVFELQGVRFIKGRKDDFPAYATFDANGEPGEWQRITVGDSKRECIVVGRLSVESYAQPEAAEEPKAAPAETGGAGKPKKGEKQATFGG